ncbi:MAG: hypothetical protein AAGF01_01670 [Cyanobacteria bacterium P01_G01_bin.38]
MEIVLFTFFGSGFVLGLIVGSSTKAKPRHHTQVRLWRGIYRRW